MSYCYTCGGYPYECECAKVDKIVSYSPEGYPLNAANEVVMSQCTMEMKREIYAKLMPTINMRVRQAV